MTLAEFVVVAYLWILIAILYICKWIRDDGHKKLLAKIIRHIESHKRKRKKKGI